MKVRELVDLSEGEGATTSGDIAGYPKPMRVVPQAMPCGHKPRRKRTRVRAAVTEAWKTRQVGDDAWEVKVGKKWVQGRWRTVGKQRIFLKGGGGTLPAQPNLAKAAETGTGGKRARSIWQRIGAAMKSFKAGWQAGGTRSRKESVDMSGIRAVAQRLQEAEGMRAASKNVIELLAVDMAEAPKVVRRLGKVLGDRAEGAAADLATALMPAITKWIEAQGVKVQGAAAAEKALKQAAK